MTDQVGAKDSMLSRLGGSIMVLAVGLALGGIIAMAPDIAAAALVLLLPGILAVLFDFSPGRAIGKTVLLCQAAATIRPIVGIWYQCEGLRACVSMATDRRTVLIVVLAGLGGFLLTQALPLGLKLLDDARLKIRCDALEVARQKLVAEWDLEK